MEEDNQEIEVPEDTSPDIIREIRIFISTQTTNQDFDPKLRNICESMDTLSSTDLRLRVAVFLKERFPKKENRRPRQRQNRPPAIVTGRRKTRQIRYQETQKQWTRNPTKCIQGIIGDIKSSDRTPPKEIMIPFWTRVMTIQNDTSPGFDVPDTIGFDLMAPITSNEVIESYPPTSTSPGPDRVTSEDVRSMNNTDLTVLLNLLLLCDRPPNCLSESRTILIPKKENASEPGDYRPITISSVIIRCLHKILAKRIDKFLILDERQRAFRAVDGCSINTHLVDLALKHHRKYTKNLYMASIDISKAFDSVTHQAIEDTMRHYGFPPQLVDYIMRVYQNSYTTLACDDWTSERCHPTIGVKQGDPLLPILFNMVIDRLALKLPNDIGARIGDFKINAAAFADDMVFLASSRIGLQRLIDIAYPSLHQMGLSINSAKSHTISFTTIPKTKKCVVNASIKFSCGGDEMPALTRSMEWKYLGISFTA